MNTTNETAPGICLPCPLCTEESASITLNLADGRTFFCNECSTEFDADLIRSIIRKWAKVLVWVDTMPTQEQVDAE